MEHDEKFWVAQLGIAATTVVILVLGSCTLHNRHVEKMAELGYQKESIAGIEHAVWRKADNR